MEYRQRVIDLTDEGLSGTEIAEVLGVSGSWVNSIKRLHRAGRSLAPQSRPGDILVMDNLQTHKARGVGEAVTAREAQVLYLPPYSPDLNPIEMAFSKVKSELRRRRLRTIGALWTAFGDSLDWVAPEEAHNYFAHAGHTAQ